MKLHCIIGDLGQMILKTIIENAAREQQGLYLVYSFQCLYIAVVCWLPVHVGSPTSEPSPQLSRRQEADVYYRGYKRL